MKDKELYQFKFTLPKKEFLLTKEFLNLEEFDIEFKVGPEECSREMRAAVEYTVSLFLAHVKEHGKLQ